MPRSFLVALLVGLTLLTGCATAPQTSSSSHGETTGGSHPDFWEGTDHGPDTAVAEKPGWWQEHPFIKYACITLGVSALIFVTAVGVTLAVLLHDIH
jgi:hypothetical protein